VQDGGEREQGEAGGVPLTPLGSPFGRAIIQMVDHDVLVEIARSQERMYVAAPSLNHHTLPHISTWSIAQSLGFPSLQWPSYPRYDCCVFAVHSSCRRSLVCSCTLCVKPQSHASACAHLHTHTHTAPTHHSLTSPHLTRSLALLPTTSQAHSLTSPRVTRSLCCQPPHRLKRFEKTNEKLDSFNEVAQARLAESQVTFARHTQLLLDAKKDLQSVFRRIRTLKARLSERYPEAFTTVQAGKTVVRGAQVDADEDDEQWRHETF